MATGSSCDRWLPVGGPGRNRKTSTYKQGGPRVNIEKASESETQQAATLGAMRRDAELALHQAIYEANQDGCS